MLFDTWFSVRFSIEMSLEMHDESVTEENARPSLPLTRITSPALLELLRLCWHNDSFQRPAFSKIAAEVKMLRVMAGTDAEESPNPPVNELKQEPVSRPSPDMLPTELPKSCGFPIEAVALKLIRGLSLSMIPLSLPFHPARQMRRWSMTIQRPRPQARSRLRPITAGHPSFQVHALKTLELALEC